MAAWSGAVLHEETSLRANLFHCIGTEKYTRELLGCESLELSTISQKELVYFYKDFETGLLSDEAAIGVLNIESSFPPTNDLLEAIDSVTARGVDVWFRKFEMVRDGWIGTLLSPESALWFAPDLFRCMFAVNTPLPTQLFVVFIRQ